MASAQPIPIQLNGRSHTPTTRFFSHGSKPTEQRHEESDLLKAIRTTLQGSRGSAESTVTSVITPSYHTTAAEEELSWDTYTVILSAGGVILKKWNFETEGQPVQWACIGWFERPGAVPTSASARSGGSVAEEDDPQESTIPEPGQRPTFGPFARHSRKPNPQDGQSHRARAVFVLLRSIGKIFFLNGLDYAFHLPFIVRRAWALSPHGIMLQRPLETSELEEARASGDEPLPTLFTMVNAFAEASVVGLTPSIKDGLPVSLHDVDPDKAASSVPAQEEVLWVSSSSSDPTDQLLATIDKGSRTVTLWRYTYVQSHNYTPPVPHPTPRNGTRHRQSLSGALSPRRASINPLIAPHELHEQGRVSSLAGLPLASNPTGPMAAIVPGSVSDAFLTSTNAKAARTSLGALGRLELLINLDKPTAGGKVDLAAQIDPVEQARMRPSYWVEKLYSVEITPDDCTGWRDLTFGIFDRRWDGEREQTRVAICTPSSGKLTVLTLTKRSDKTLLAGAPIHLSAVSVAPVRALRAKIDDLLLLKPDGSLHILTYGLIAMPLHLDNPTGIVSLKDAVESSVTLCLDDRRTVRAAFNYWPTSHLTERCFHMLAMVLSTDAFFSLHHGFLLRWSAKSFVQNEQTFDLLRDTIYDYLGLDRTASMPLPSDPWDSLGRSSSLTRFSHDPALRNLSMPKIPTAHNPAPHRAKSHRFHSSILNGLHHLAQCFMLSTTQYLALLRLVPVVCRLALVVRPEWADYWKRLLPDVLGPWKSPKNTVLANLDEGLSVWPQDAFSMLYGRINNLDWSIVTLDSWQLILPAGTPPSFAFGKRDPLLRSHQVNAIYQALANSKEKTWDRAEVALKQLARSVDVGHDILNRLPVGLALPMYEAVRTCQMAPLSEWPIVAHQFIGRNDLADSFSDPIEVYPSNGYRTIKDFVLPTFTRKCFAEQHEEARKGMAGELAAVSGVELGQNDFTSARFGQDKRLDEVARMLCSSTVPSIKTLERPELSEVDQAKEHQHYAMRVAERTLALPPGRALFTFASVLVVTKEAYAVPKIEYSIRIQPQNVLIVPEAGKIPIDCSSWGDFHNGVAAGLRISPTANNVQSSWITFNKPSELTPEHAGFLYALGLTGHLREMLTWHTFAYLTPKHDLTSIAILLGLSAANVGTGNRHVTKLIAVHTPALLPTPGVDLNVPLITQAAGLSGLGLLYIGTRNRRMAEVCLSQISRRDLVQQDLSNEYREAYTYCAALAFGMIMLGRGSDVPADLVLLSRLRVLIHGEAHALDSAGARPTFDVNLTSPAGSIALGLMYLRTNRQDVADILTIPDTVIALDRIQPSFLMIRTIARALIMWDRIKPNMDWLLAQLPEAIRVAMDVRPRAKFVHESFELAYYNILAGACFAVALKYAGTAREEAYLLLLKHHDQFSSLAYTSSPAFDHRIKRAAVRDGLNLISISLNMVMAGTGEVNCLRRLRYSFGMYNPPVRYGTHVAIHMSIGLLFLGGGKYTLGTSDAAIAAMVAAFFPRFNQVSSDNKSYLQALRHLWVLAVEPRCMVPRDVDTREVVFLPIKIKVKDGDEIGTNQLIAPTLIPDVDKLQSIRIDTPRYWPFSVDFTKFPTHVDALLKSQTLWVKRRTAFLSYMEDPKGSRSLFVRSGSSAGDAAVLEFPQLKNTSTHPATELHHFISSYSNDPFFLAFADRFCRDESETEDERLFHGYCYAALHDSILQDKPQTIQIHLTLYRYRRMSLTSPFLILAHQDLKFAHEFYSKIYIRRFSGHAENNLRPSLLRETALRSGLHELEAKLDMLHKLPSFAPLLQRYARGSEVPVFEPGSPYFEASKALAWYLQRNSVPTSSVLLILRDLVEGSRARCLEQPPPQGTVASVALDEGIKSVVQKAGSQLTSSLGSGWPLKCVEEIMSMWNIAEPSPLQDR